MSAANGKYHISVSWVQDVTANKVNKVPGVYLELKHSAMQSEYRSTQEYTLAEAQKVRDAAIRAGADGTHIHIRY